MYSSVVSASEERRKNLEQYEKNAEGILKSLMLIKKQPHLLFMLALGGPREVRACESILLKSKKLIKSGREQSIIYAEGFFGSLASLALNYHISRASYELRLFNAEARQLVECGHVHG